MNNTPKFISMQDCSRLFHIQPELARKGECLYTSGNCLPGRDCYEYNSGCNISVSLLFICYKLFDMYTPTCAPLLSQCLSSEVEYELRRKGEKEGSVITTGVMGWIEEGDQSLVLRIGISRERRDKLNYKQ